jgi:predicted S18 family serine protease
VRATEAPRPTDAPKPTDTPKPVATNTPAPTATPAARSSELTALWFATENGKVIGGSSRVKVNVAPNENKDLRVGFFENEVGGSGPMWRSAGWMAAAISTLLSGVDPTKSQISFDVGGRIDGPSAGGLMTVGVLAALRGDKVREDAAMTGTINPDGTIGAVGGIPQKVDGAARAGKKLVLIPAGQRQSPDYAEKRVVDVFEVGRRLNVEVVEVADIYAAYRVMTGVDLPRGEANPPRPEVAGLTYDKIKAKGTEWLARYEEAGAQFKALAEEVKIDELKGLMAAADASARKSRTQSNQGLVTGAYLQAQKAGMFASIAGTTGRILETYIKKGFDGAVQEMKATSASTTKVQALADSLRADTPKTLIEIGNSQLYKRLAALCLRPQGSLATAWHLCRCV